MKSTLASASALFLFAMPASAQTFAVNSPDLGHGFTDRQMQAASYGFGCEGGNISPEIDWSGAPKGTQSFAVSIYDRDAPTGSGFWHWVVANIPASATGLAAGAGTAKAPLPDGAVQTRTDFGVPGYGGPCPPKGTTHTYAVTVTALGAPKIPVDGNTTPAIAGFMTNANALAKATMEVKLSR
jgi:Raf kinase inhibitor-like YbhB/YbcL family protein